VLKFVAATVWIIAASVGAVHYAYQSGSAAPAVEAEASIFGGLDYVKSDVISIPILREGEVYGYFLTRLVFTAEQKKLAQLTIPIQAILVDELYTHLYGNPQIDFSRRNPMDLDQFREDIRTAINGRVETDLIHEVMVEQLEFLTKAEIRERNATGGWGEAAQEAPEPTPAAAAGHH
jgi:hypothetical protein